MKQNTDSTGPEDPRRQATRKAAIIQEAVERLMVEVPAIPYPPPDDLESLEARKRLLTNCITPILQSLTSKLLGLHEI